MTRARDPRVRLGVDEVEPAPSVVSIGFFDGVHRGHQVIVARAVQVADAHGLRSVVVTFDRHPMEVIRPGSQPPLLMTLARRLHSLADLDVDLVLALPFDDDLRHLPPEDFVDRILAGPLQARHVVVGANFRFGHRASGDLRTLTDLGPARGFAAVGVTLLELDGAVISSTEIRAALERGEVERAARLLGRPHVLDGIVIRGDGRGAALGFPTANVAVDPRAAIPAPGVYAGIVDVPGGSHPAAISVGTNPTFGGHDLRVEAYLLDFDGDLYGTEAAVDFRHRLRGQERYDAVEGLVRQMQADVAEARRLVSP